MYDNVPQSPQPFHNDLETIDGDEPETANALAETMLSISRKTFEDSGHAMRAVHAKSHGILHGKFEVMPNLPSQLAQGLFAKPATYDAVMRFSSTPGDLVHDSVSTPRGFALKVFDVPGERMGSDDESRSQDFIGVNGKQFNASSAVWLRIIVGSSPPQAGPCCPQHRVRAIRRYRQPGHP